MGSLLGAETIFINLEIRKLMVSSFNNLGLILTYDKKSGKSLQQLARFRGFLLIM